MDRPALPKMLARGALRRCPWCGGRLAFFDGWFAKSERCHTCGIPWRRGDVGFELGAATISAILVFGTLMVALGVGFVSTWPDVPYLALGIVLGVMAVLLPVAAYPISYTLWQALDLVMRPPEPGDGTPDPVR